LRVVFFGDSLTEGTHGASYLEVLRSLLAQTPALSAVELINAGVGGDTVENLLRRLATDVAPHDPSWVVVLIGANDCTTLLIRRGLWRPLVFWRSRRYFLHEKGVSSAITPQRFEAGLCALVTEIRSQTHARIALCTPPPQGVEPRSPRWRLMARYAEAISRVAVEVDCDLIDLNTRWSAVARDVPRQTLRQRWRVLLGALRGDGASDIETLARERGYILTFDGVHFSARGAALAAEVMRDWLATVAMSADPASSHPRRGDPDLQAWGGSAAPCV
jgi:lysophospholipase L1-like esterase